MDGALGSLDAVRAAAVGGLGFIGSGDDVSGAAIGQATIGEPVETPFHSGGYASFPERVKLVCGKNARVRCS